MASEKTFNGVTPAIWECVKTASGKEHGTVYAPPGANQGTATTDTPVGQVILNFNFDPAGNSVAYSIAKKPFIVSADQIWKGIQDSINNCK